MNKLSVFLLAIIFMLLGALGWSYLSKPISIPITQIQQPKQIVPTSIQIDDTTKTIIPSTEPTLDYVNPSVAIDAFETAIPAKKYADLSEFMAPTVTVIKYATSCCGPLSREKAIAEMAYLSGATGTWNFADTNPIAKKLETADSETFKEMYIGTAGNYYTVALHLNDDFYIDKVFLTNDYRLITGQ